jgi:spermidine synthase
MKLALRTPPPLLGASDEFLAALRKQGEVLMQFYASGLAAYRGDRDGWARALGIAMRADPNNPYFRWIAGEGG